MRSWRTLLFIPPVVLAAAITAFLVINRRTPAQDPPREVARTLRVMTLEPRTVSPQLVGYGTASPARVWKAVAEVSGRVTKTHPALDPGGIVREGEMVITIDPTDYELTQKRLQAEVDSFTAQLDELDIRETSTKKFLAIEQQSLALSKAELERLRSSGAARTEYDQQRRIVLTQQQAVTNQANELALIPTQRRQLSAGLESAQAQLDQAERDLERTTITAPFLGRVATVNVEQGQFATKGETLLILQDAVAAEVDARVPIDEMRSLIPVSADGRLAVKSFEEFADTLTITVRVVSVAGIRAWSGKMVRVREQVDAKTRSLGLIVAVEHSEFLKTNTPPEEAPRPLLENTFCEVTIRGRPLENKLVVPRSAFRDDGVYIVDADNRLRHRKVTATLKIGEELIVEGDLKAGERVVLSDPTPAVIGMLVHPVEGGP